MPRPQSRSPASPAATPPTRHNPEVGVSDQNRSAHCRMRGVTAELTVADPGGGLHAVQGNVEQHGTDHTSLWSPLLGGREPTFLNHSRLQPSSYPPLCRERAQ